jgi:hypothetical protein
MQEDIVSSRRKLNWKWLKGAQTELSDFGDPTTTTSYALCVYDEVGGVPASTTTFDIAPANLCGSDPCWKAKGERGFKYKNDAGNADGITSILMKSGQNGKAKVIVKGRGLNLALPAPATLTELLNQDTAVTVQLVNSVNKCWTTEFISPALKNEVDLFRDKE